MGSLADMRGERIDQRIIVGDRINGWIQVIAEVQPDGPNRRMVAQSDSGRVRKVVEAALALRAGRSYWAGRCNFWVRRVATCSWNIGDLAGAAVGLANAQGA